MKFIKTFILICVLSFVSAGCETLKGAKQDMNKFFFGTSQEDSWVRKADDWMKENMW